MNTNKLTNYQDFFTQRMEEIKAEQLANNKEFRPNKYRQRPAREWVRQYLSDTNNIEKVPYAIREALSVLFLETKRELSQKSLVNRFLNIFTYDGETISSVAIFKETGLGVNECRSIINKRLAKAHPNDRLWIDHVLDDEGVVNYKLCGIGATPPDGWDGYIPNDKIIL